MQENVVFASAGIFVVIACLLSSLSVYYHLKNYRCPELQRRIVRILWMVPIYALDSWISLAFPKSVAPFIDTLRDAYEAFVLYTFFQLLVNYLGGERALLWLFTERRTTVEHLYPLKWCLSPVDLGTSPPKSYVLIKRGILQYVVVKSLLTVLTLILEAVTLFDNGNLSPRRGYFWVTIFYNISICICMYCLVLFYLATQRDLKQFHPLSKFLCIKAVIFFSFWQSTLIALSVKLGVLRGIGNYSAAEVAVAVQDYLICLEMMFAAIAHFYAFPVSDFEKMYSNRLPFFSSAYNVFSMKDVVQDAYDTFLNPPGAHDTEIQDEGVSSSEKTLPKYFKMNDSQTPIPYETFSSNENAPSDPEDNQGKSTSSMQNANAIA